MKCTITPLVVKRYTRKGALKKARHELRNSISYPDQRLGKANKLQRLDVYAARNKKGASAGKKNGKGIMSQV